VTPLRVMTGVAALARFRRMVGLFVFFYASLHGLAYAWFDMGFLARGLADLEATFHPGWIRQPVSVVCTGFDIFNDWAIRRLGGKGWKRLHRSVYAIAGWHCCIFSGCAPARTILQRSGCMPFVLGVLLGWRVVKITAKKHVSPLCIRV
jgi:sulfoxide reductase heme-binding subunit YedZ